MEKPVLYIVIPCYNEQEVLPVTSGMFLEKVKGLAAAGKVSEKSRVMFVNDGSKDNTSVSYTHLDVYKRQALWCSTRRAPTPTP